MDPASAIILFVLFQTAERFISYTGGKVADSLSKPIWDALENKARWLAEEDETTKRWRAFTRAYRETKAKFLEAAPDKELANLILNTLERGSLKANQNRVWLKRVGMELEKASLITDKPNVHVISELILAATETPDQQPPSLLEFSDAIVSFVSLFQDKLFDQSEYMDLLLKKKEWQQLRKIRYDTRDHYLLQIEELHKDLEFVGIPELKDKQSILIEDVFIQLQAEGETGIYEALKTRTSVNSALQQHKLLVILGDPGAGKTTLLKYITLILAKDQGKNLGLKESQTPLFIRLHEYVTKRAGRGEDYSLIDFLYTQARESLMVILEPGFFEEELMRGNCCICLDGLDELGTPGLRREIANIVTALVSRFPKNRYIVTSRIVGYNEAPLDRSKFSHYTILPLADDDIKQFIQKWYRAREKNLEVAIQRAESLSLTILGESRIKALATNPLMLTIIALVHRIEAELPHERVKLYEKCVATLVETWDLVKGISAQERERPYYRLRRRLLEQLAMGMHSQPGLNGRVREIKEGDLELYLAVFLIENPKLQLDSEQARQEAHDFIELAKARTGLIIERGEGIYTFAHLTFQEYLAAMDIEHRLAHSIDAIWAEIQPKLFDAHWYEVILLLLGGLNRFEKHPTELVKYILKDSDRFEAVLHRRVFLATRVLADKIEVNIDLYNGIIDALLEIIRHDPLARNDALIAIQSLKGSENLKTKLSSLADNTEMDHQMQVYIAQLLGEAGQEVKALELLSNIIYDSSNFAETRRHAVEVLGELSSLPACRSLLYRVATEATMGHLQIDAMKALWKSESQEGVIAMLLGVIRNWTTDSDRRQYALKVLGDLGQFDLLKRLSSGRREHSAREYEESDAWLRKMAQETLGQYNVQLSLSDLLALSRTRKSYTGFQEDLLPLFQIESPDARATLLLELALDRRLPSRIQEDAIIALGQLNIANEKVTGGLRKIVRNSKIDMELRSKAATVLAKLGYTDDIITVLLNILNNPKIPEWTKEDALEALTSDYRNEKLSDLLLSVARDTNIEADLRCGSAYAIGQLEYTEDASNILFEIAIDIKVDERTRKNAYQGLKSLLGAPI